MLNLKKIFSRKSQDSPVKMNEQPEMENEKITERIEETIKGPTEKTNKAISEQSIVDLYNKLKREEIKRYKDIDKNLYNMILEALREALTNLDLNETLIDAVEVWFDSKRNVLLAYFLNREAERTVSTVQIARMGYEKSVFNSLKQKFKDMDGYMVEDSQRTLTSSTNETFGIIISFNDKKVEVKSDKVLIHHEILKLFYRCKEEYLAVRKQRHAEIESHISTFMEVIIEIFETELQKEINRPVHIVNMSKEDMLNCIELFRGNNNSLQYKFNNWANWEAKKIEGYEFDEDLLNIAIKRFEDMGFKTYKNKRNSNIVFDYHIEITRGT